MGKVKGKKNRDGYKMRRKDTNIADFSTVPFLLAASIEKEAKEKEPSGGEG